MMFASVRIVLLCCLVGWAATSKETVEHGSPVHHGKQTHENKDGEHNPHYDHESILGSSKLEEEFDELPPEEAKYRLKLLVKKMNKDGDQWVTKEELTDWILMSYRMLDREDALEEMEEKDTDRDNRISWEEYQSAQYSYSPEEMAELKANPQEDLKDFLIIVDEDERKFQSADVNKDGYLDREEYVAFSHPYNYEHMHHIELERTMTDNDGDKNGVITLQEFLGHGESPDKEWRLVEEERFKDYDKNNDNHLDMSEIREWVLNDNRQEAEDEADHLIGVADADNDNQLTEEEIVESYQEFVGSQATNFGEHLHTIKDEL